MHRHASVVITSIQGPNRVIREIAHQCVSRQLNFCVIGDVSSPTDFDVEGCSFYSIERQLATGLRTAALCPKRHYARKNVGYLLSIRGGYDVIIETDDDNFPLPDFWRPRKRLHRVPCVEGGAWVNVYKHFTDANVWPRGLPLQAIHLGTAPAAQEAATEVECPIQQGLAADNPDVDAIYRLVLPLPVNFAADRSVALRRGAWSPFNSQNTTWFHEAFALLYLPAYCSFRVTDIWRSFVAQRIAWENGWSVLFESPTVVQDRNEHNFMRDFEDEIPGYLHNDAIAEALDALSLRAGADHIQGNLLACYETLVRHAWVGPQELPLLNAWLDDLRAVAVTP